MSMRLQEPITEKQLRHPCSCGLNPQGIYKPRACWEHSEHGAVCFFCWICGAHRPLPADDLPNTSVQLDRSVSGAGYLDWEAKAHQNGVITPENGLDETADDAESGLSTHFDIQCPWGLVSIPDAQGHQFAQDVLCGREWCSYCGGKNGKAHQRRKARLLPKARQMPSIGYFTLTIPPSARPRDVDELRKLGRQVTRIFQYRGFKRGIRRWHWFGDESDDWNPHLNVLVDAGWLEPEVIAGVKRSWARALGVSEAVVYYEYAEAVPSMLHIVKYVLRPTFLDWRWDVYMADKLHGFRNTVIWGLANANSAGYWNDEPVWEVPEAEKDEYAPAVEKLVESVCPDCGEPIEWDSKVVSIGELLVMGWRELGAGFYRRAGPAPPGTMSRKELKRRALAASVHESWVNVRNMQWG